MGFSGFFRGSLERSRWPAVFLFFRAAARELGKSHTALLRMKNDGRLAAGGYLVPGVRVGIDRIKMTQEGRLPLRDFVVCWSQYQQPAAGSDPSDPEPIGVRGKTPSVADPDGLLPLETSSEALSHWQFSLHPLAALLSSIA
jgi:hypothetical protein